MAIYSLSIKPASRGAGQNALAMAAYRSGGRLIDQRTGEIKDYSRKAGITYTGIFYPAGVSFSRQELWNMAEKAERRKDSRIAREILLALPHELPPEKREELAKSFAQDIVKKYQIAVDLSLHNPDRGGDKRNFHAHLLLTTRQINKEGLTEKSDLEREDKYLRQNGKKNGREQIEEIRKDWENRCNLALERAGREERISAKSYHARNIARVPTIHLGKSATVLERRGIKTEIGNKNRAIRNHNRILYLRWKRNITIREIQQLDNEIRALQQTPREMPGKAERTAPGQQLLKEMPGKAERTAPGQQLLKEMPGKAERTAPGQQLLKEMPGEAERTAPGQQLLKEMPGEDHQRPAMQPETERITRAEQPPREMPRESLKKGIAELLDNARKKPEGMEKESGKNMSITELLNKAKYKSKEGITRDKDGLER